MLPLLRWEPSYHKGHNLPDALRYALEKNPAGNDRRHFGEASIPYLEGLRDAGVDGAQQLIDAIEKCGDVDVYWEY